MSNSGQDPKSIRLANKRSEAGLCDESRRLRDEVLDLRHDLRSACAEAEDAIDQLKAAKERLAKRDGSQARVKKLEQERLRLIGVREQLSLENDHLSGERDAALKEIKTLELRCLALDSERDRLVADGAKA